jgi:hypothetical protein
MITGNAGCRVCKNGFNFRLMAYCLMLLSMLSAGCKYEWYDPSDMSAAPEGMITRVFAMFCQYPPSTGEPFYNQVTVTFSLPDNGLPLVTGTLHLWVSCESCSMSVTVDSKWSIVDETTGTVTNTMSLQSGENDIWVIPREIDNFFCDNHERSLTAWIRTYESTHTAIEIVKDASLQAEYCEDGCNGGDPDRPYDHSCCLYDIPWWEPPDYHLDQLCFTSGEYYEFLP